MTVSPRSVVSLLLLGAAGCLTPPTYQDHRVACGSDTDCAWLDAAATCSLAGFCTVSPLSEDGGDVDAGWVDAGSEDAGPGDAGVTDAGASDAGATDGGDGGWSCPQDPCVLPSVEILEPASDAAVSSPLEITLMATAGDLPIQEISCYLTPPLSAYALAAGTGPLYTCTLPLDEVQAGGDFAVAVTAVDVLFQSVTDLRWYTCKD